MRKLIYFFVLILASGCDSGPKVIEAEPTTGQAPVNTPNSGSAVDQAMSGSAPATADGQHKVVAEEILNTQRYTYVKVSENGASHWVALPLMDVEVGATYYYTGGLLKKNFESREHNRVFETLYLLNNFNKEQTQTGASTGGQATGTAASSAPPPTSVIKPTAGAISIGDLVKNKAKYAGKVVAVTGKVTKVNPNIMGKNWLHLQDGTGNNFDLTVTSIEVIPAGHTVTLEGTVSLDKDLGAGYRYDILLEDAKVRQ